MARNITFKIITQAQTNALEELNKQLKEVRDNLNNLTKGQKRTIDKALGLDQTEKQAEDALAALRKFAGELDDLASSATKAGNRIDKAGDDIEETTDQLERSRRAARLTDEAYEKLSGTTTNFRRDMDGLGKKLRESDSALGEVSTTLTRHLSGALKNGARDVGTVLTELRLLRAEAGKVDKAVEGMKVLPDELAAANKKLARATEDVAEAQSKLYAARNDPNRTTEQIEEATRALQKSNETYEEAARDVERLDKKFKQFGSTINQAERRVAKIRNTIERNKLEEFIPASAMNQLRTVDDSLISAGRAVRKFGSDATRGLRQAQVELGALAGRRTQLAALSEELEDMRKEMVALSRLDLDILKERMGSPSAAVRSATTELIKQNKVVVDLVHDLDRLTRAQDKFGDAQREAARYAEQGTHSLREQQKVNQLYAKSLAEARTVETGLRSRDRQLVRDRMDLVEAQRRLNDQLDAAKTKLSQFGDTASADYKRAARQVEQLTEALDLNNRALQENENNTRQNANALRVASSVIENIEADRRGLLGVFDRVKKAYDEELAAARRSAQEQSRLSRQHMQAVRAEADFQRAIRRENMLALQEQDRQERQRLRDQIRMQEQARAEAARNAREAERIAKQTADKTAREAAQAAREVARAEKRAADERIRELRRVEREQAASTRRQMQEINRLSSVGRLSLAATGGGPGGPIPPGSINVFREMIAVIRSVNQTAMQMASTFAGGLRAAINAAANAARGFIQSAGSMFAGLQRSLQSISGHFRNFGNNVARSMDVARASMMEFYAAGYSLLTVGSQIQQFGNMMFRGMGQSLEGFMNYERARIQAGIAGAQPVDANGNVIPQGADTPVGGYTINSKIIDDIIFDLQRGTATPEWLRGDGGRIPITFDAQELAKGLYYYSSAIGAPITAQNQGDVSAAVATIMMMADITDTGVETATKGVLNVMMEFGYDPRAIGSTNDQIRAQAARDTAMVASQMGYLANISSMEVSDIVETFKMVGPQAHFLSPGALQGEAGAGLTETFGLAYLASEVGLRGGNVGRGVNQAFTSLLDPTKKMLEVAGKHFGDGTALTVEEFNAIFKDGRGALKGGITGFLQTLSTIPRELQAQMLAELFTSNATRALMGPVLAGGGFDIDEWIGFLEDMEQNPFSWMEAAAAETANSVSGWFDFMKNGWFQFQSAIIGSVSGPLMGAFRLIGEVLFEIAERMRLNPAIGQSIAAVISAVAGLATVLGTLMIGAGAILLVGRSFAMLGGMVLPFIRILAMAGVTIFALIPAIAAVAVAVGLFKAAFDRNLFGIQDGVNAVKNAFSDFDGVILPIIEGIMDGIGQLGAAFSQFVNGILLGSGAVGTLNTVLTRAFGSLLGPAIMNGLLHLRESLNGTRDALREFFSDRTINGNIFQAAALSFRGFIEQLTLGRMSLEAYGAAGILGDALGIDNFHMKLVDAADAFGVFAGKAIYYGQFILTAWTGLAGQIRDNIVRAFSATGGLDGIFSSLSTIAQGVVQGMVSTFTVLLGAIEIVTGKIADFAQGLREAGASGRDILGFTVTFQGALRAIGVTIGAVLGTRLVLAFAPFATILARVIPMVTGFAAILSGLAGHFIVLAGNILISVAAWGAKLAVMALVAAAKAGHLGVTAATAAAELGEAASSTALSTAKLVLAAALSIAMAASAAFIGAIATLAAGELFAAGATGVLTVAVGLLVAPLVLIVLAATAAVAIFLVFAGILAAIAGAMVFAAFASGGFLAGLSAIWQVLQGVWTGLSIAVEWITVLGSAFASVTSKIAGFFGVSDKFYAVGVAIGVALSMAVIAATLLGLALTALALVILSPIIALGLLGYAIYKLVTSFDDAWNALTVGAKGAMLALEFTIADSLSGISDHIDKWVNGIKALASIAPDWVVPEGLENYSPSTNVIGAWKDDTARQLKEHNDAVAAGSAEVVATTDQAAGDIAESNSALMSALNAIGLGDDAQRIAIELGIDLNTADIGDVKSIISELVNMPTDLGQEVDWGQVLGPKGEDYGKALSDWETYQADINRLVNDYGYTMEHATNVVNAQWMALRGFVPEYPNIVDYMGDMADGMEDEAERIKVTMEDLQTSLRDYLTNMTLEGSIDLFKNLEGLGNVETVGSTLMAVGDKILENAGDVPWLNMTELLMDAAGTGDFNAQAVGQNIHDQIRPALEHTARQLGVSVETLLQDVPKFIAPEGLVNFATGEFLRLLDGMPEDVYSKLDTLGIAQGWNEFGLDWSELMVYGTSMAMEGLDWNLADYIAESYGIEVEEAERQLRAVGIDPDMISDSWFEMTEQAALTMDGQLTVLTQDMVTMAEAYRNAAEGAFITVTESELRNMPEAVKQYLDSLGYVFVLDDTPNDVLQWGNNVNDAIKGLTQDDLQALPKEVQDFLTSVGIAFREDGTPIDAETWASKLRIAVDTPEEWYALPEEVRAFLESIGITFQNDDTASDIAAWGDGIASAALEAAKKISDAMNIDGPRDPMDPAGGSGRWFPVFGEGLDDGWTGYMDRRVGDYQSYLDQLHNAGWGAGMGGGPTGGITAGGGNAPVQQQVDVVYNYPDPQEARTATAASLSGGTIGPQGQPRVEVEVKMDYSQIKTDDITKALGGEEGQVKIKAGIDFEHFSQAVSNLLVTINNISEGAQNFKMKVGLNFEYFSGEVSNLLVSLANISSNDNFKMKIGLDFSYFSSQVSNMLVSLGNISSNDNFKMKIGIELDDSALDALNNIPGHPDGKTPAPTIDIKVNADTSAFDASISTLGVLFTSGERGPIKIPVQADTTNFTTALTGEAMPTIKVKIEAETPDLSFLNLLPGAPDGKTPAPKITITVDAGNSADVITGINTQLTGIAKAWIPVVSINAGNSSTIISGLQNQLDTLAKAYIAVISINAGNSSSIISGIQGQLDDIVGTYSATVTVSVSGLGDLQSAYNLLSNFPGSVSRTVSVTNITNNVTSNSTINQAMGGRVGSAGLLGRKHDYSAIVPRATGGTIQPGEYTLVGELGPELVRLPTGSYVHTARESARMFKRQLEAQRTFEATVHPRHNGGGPLMQQIGTATPQHHSTYTPPSFGRQEPVSSRTTNETKQEFHFHGDIVIGDRKAGEDFFAELDRRSGKRTQLANRGMYPTDDIRPW